MDDAFATKKRENKTKQSALSPNSTYLAGIEQFIVLDDRLAFL
jgi:hypothetical protein